MPEICLASIDARAEEAATLRARYGFSEQVESSLRLQLSEDGLSFYSLEAPKERLRIDFLRGRTGYRLGTAGHTRQPLLRAVGCRGRSIHVLDCTAGLGRDMMTLAIGGCCVSACERSPVLAALLSDALTRATEDGGPLAEVIRERVTLAHAEACEKMRTLAPPPEVIYLDPMFPERQKSALVKKELRLIRLAAGDDEDAEALLAQARSVATERVVVKRPASAPPLAPDPTHQIKEKTIRFDIYAQ